MNWQTFNGLDRETQAALSRLCDQLYDPYDCTPLQELAARAYLMGKEDEGSRRLPELIRNICTNSRATYRNRVNQVLGVLSR